MRALGSRASLQFPANWGCVATACYDTGTRLASRTRSRLSTWVLAGIGASLVIAAACVHETVPAGSLEQTTRALTRVFTPGTARATPDLAPDAIAAAASLAPTVRIEWVDAVR